MKSKSKKAFDHNVEAEMESGKPKDQSLAIAYGVKRNNKGKKKMAEGGEVKPVSAAQAEKRPMPDQRANDSKMASQNDHKRDNGQDSWTDQPTVKQAQMNNGRQVLPIKYPKLQGSGAFQVKLRDEEDDLQESAKTGSYAEQPDSAFDEKDAKKSGPSVPSLKMKLMADGGMINEAESMRDAEEDEDPEISPIRESYDSPAKDEFMADHFADGGEVGVSEQELEHAASIAGAIMARRKFARGGEILSEDSMESDDSDQADLSRNAEEDANMEDKASFDALRKENYSESDALEESTHPEDSNIHEPEHDEEDVDDRSVVGAIRRKMKSKSPISR